MKKRFTKFQVKHLVQLINTPKGKAINGTSSPGAALDNRTIPPKELSVPIVVDGIPLRPSANSNSRNAMGLHISEHPTPTNSWRGRRSCSCNVTNSYQEIDVVGQVQ